MKEKRKHIKRKVHEKRLDNTRHRDGKGKWLTDIQYRNDRAHYWQIVKLKTLGCPEANLKDIRFHIANRLIAKLIRNRHRSGTAPQSQAGSERGTTSRSAI